MTRTTVTSWGNPVDFTYHVTDPARGNDYTVCGMNVYGTFTTVLSDPYRAGRVTCKRCLRALPSRMDISPADD